jgi:type II secretory ATPase GspE/PulE/Tfp pilus assembly ATPase PilB-like protein
MGITSSVIAQALKGVVSTRLLRKICSSCKVEYQLGSEEKRRLGLAENIQNLYKGQGCNNCKNLGYLGRIGVYEITNFDDDIKDAIIEKRPASFLTELIDKKQTKKLRAAALEKVTQGISTIDEVIRVLGFISTPPPATM